MKIGLLSDTHGHLDQKIFSYFENCDEIWHAGDIGSLSVADELEKFRPFRAITGNIDDHNMRLRYPEDLHFMCEGKKIFMTHIAGSPTKYNARVKKILVENCPDVLICGHSHILKVINDKSLHVLYLNPGAAGNHGFHPIKTMLRFEISDSIISNMEVIELGKRGVIER